MKSIKYLVNGKNKVMWYHWQYRHIGYICIHQSRSVFCTIQSETWWEMLSWSLVPRRVLKRWFSTWIHYCSFFSHGLCEYTSLLRFYWVSISDIDLLGVMYCRFPLTHKVSWRIQRHLKSEHIKCPDTATLAAS